MGTDQGHRSKAQVTRFYRHYANGRVYEDLGRFKKESDPTIIEQGYRDTVTGEQYFRPPEEFFGVAHIGEKAVRRFEPVREEGWVLDH